MAKKFIKKEITPEVVSTFLEGHDPQERIVNFDYKYKDNFITIIYRDENDRKCFSRDSFKPFLWATQRACMRMCNQDRNELVKLMTKYGVWVKSLDTTNVNGEVVDAVKDGYTYMFYATKPLSYAKFLEFFKAAGNPVYSKKKEEQPDVKSSFTEQPEAKKDKKQYLVVTPVEQYMIASGKRMFKGYDDYDQCLRLSFDLETTGLNTEVDRIEQFGFRFNRPVRYKGEYIEFERIYTTEGETEEEKNQSELNNIITMIKIIYTFQPDIITAHNGETFDWNMIIGACKRLGTTIEELSAPYFDSDVITKNKRETILKLGGEIETFHQTIVPNTIITDSLHAVRRAQALDSNMLFSNLKYITKYSNIVKPNRVYVPGDKISEVWNDNEKHYAFNNIDGDWYIYDPSYVPKKITPDSNKTLEYFQNLIDTDKLVEEVSGGTVNRIYDDSETAEHLYNEYIKSIEEENKNAITRKGKSNDKFTLYTKNIIMDGYELVDGRYIVSRYLLDDLWECDKVEHRYNTSNFLICKMLPVPFQKCCTMGTAGQWKSLMLAWSYENDLAIPSFGESKSFTGGLSRLLKVGFVDNVAKFDYNSLYPSIILTWAISDPKDLMNTMLAFLDHVLTQREKYKGLTKKAGKKADAIEEQLQNRDYNGKEEGKKLHDELLFWKSEEAFNDKKQLPLKIFGNSFFGSYGAPNVFPWGSIDCAERTTCTGRMALRLMIFWFNKIGYKPIVGDTDGFNFKLPDTYRYTKDNPYVSPGVSRVTTEGKSYTGFDADVAEFNDLFMKDFKYHENAVNKMGLGIDEVVSSTINFSRKNYADYFPEKDAPKDVKKVGNSIKSKKMASYIANFLEKGIRLLLQKKGKEFIEEYYSYIDKIYNYQIPLKDIASKGKVKKSINEYIKDCQTVTKAGNPKARQAWMELILKHNLNVHMGETVYYINTGKSKSQADVKRVTHFYGLDGLFNDKKDKKVELEKEYKKDNIDGKLAPKDKKLNLKDWVKKHHPEITIEEEITLNCEIVPTEVIESEVDMFCEDGKEYNVPKYISQFNSRITPLLVCFHPDIRDKILITNPDDRQYFSEQECELCSGFPKNPGDQDTYEQLMTMEDKEIRFWEKHPEWKIPYLEECEMNWDDILRDYHERMEQEKELGITETRKKFSEAILNLTSSDIDNFEDGELPSSLASIIMVDPQTGNFVDKVHTEVVIGTIYDIYDAIENKVSYMEAFYDE
jgi:DNA polymerase elongation subunit (family B)